MVSTDDALSASLDRYSRLTQAMLLIRASCNPPWNELNITLPQLKVLGLLLSQGHALSGRELAGLLGVGPSAVTPLVDRLVEHGYVRRDEDLRDRRITRLMVTEGGIELLRGMMAGRREMMADLLRQLDADELATVNKALDLLLTAIERSQSASNVAAPNTATAEPVAAGAPNS
jgi:MarR family transcriptional regulator, organic hydroperoxide resistance regulator